MKKIKLLLTILLFFISINIVNASNKINSIDVEVKLDEYGNGKVTEIWNMKVDTGTEVYKPMGDLGNSTISNFQVKDENGTLYTYIPNWSIKGTLSSKAYKNGINKEDGSFELCWGMSSYGSHKYEVTYNVSNMIFKVEDADVLYWKFINDSLNPAPKKISIVVSGPEKYEDSLDVWGYGYKGYAYVSDGYIYMANEENTKFKSSDYAVLLVKYPLNTFNTQNKYSQFLTFDDVLSKAEEGSFAYNYDKLSFLETLYIIIPMIFNIGFWIVMIIIIASVTRPEQYIKKELDVKNLNNFRDIPCDKNIMKAYFISTIYKINRKKEDFLGAVLLKWLKEGNISIVKQQKKSLFGEKEITAIQLKKDISLKDESEQSLYKIMIDASGDYLLEEDELKKWCRNNYSKFFRWFDMAEKNVKEQFISEGHIVRNEKNSKKLIVDDYIYQEATKLAGLKKYLNEFSRIKEKEPIEVNLWEYYLIYAQIYGIAKEVSKQFKNLYPELIENAEYNGNATGSFYGDIMWINNITYTSVRAASSARSAASSYSGGGGGFSSGGGGHSSFGGGHGGGCR